MESYVRDSRACIAFTRGFDKPDVSLALLMMVDFMALHFEESGGIPCSPPAYLSGLLGMTQRKWTQSIEPALVGAKRIRQVTRSGIKVWVFADEYMTGPKALFKPLSSIEQDWRVRFMDDITREAEVKAASGKSVADLRAKARDGLRNTLAHMHGSSRPHGDTELEREALGLPDVPCVASTDEPDDTVVAFSTTINEELKGRDLYPTPPPKVEDIAPPKMPFPKIEDTTPVPETPSHSAYEILKQAGVAVDDHARGPLFWHRHEHNATLIEWIKLVPVNEIVVRLDKARLAGTLPEQPNSLLAFEAIVMGKK